MLKPLTIITCLAKRETCGENQALEHPEENPDFRTELRSLIFFGQSTEFRVDPLDKDLAPRGKHGRYSGARLALT